MKFVLEVLKPDGKDPEILVPVYGHEYSHQSKKFERDSFEHFIRDIRAMAEYCMDSGAECFEAKLFSDVDLAIDNPNGGFVSVVEGV